MKRLLGWLLAGFIFVWAGSYLWTLGTTLWRWWRREAIPSRRFPSEPFPVMLRSGKLRK
jgi:hypothetical protein